MTNISWHQLRLNATSKEISFESFNFQIAWQKYSKYGEFEYDYNTPGSEFYLTLHTDCDELEANSGDVVGWQAKFWIGQRDDSYSPMDKKNRTELVKGLENSLRDKKNLKTWVICTPGQLSNARPHYVKNKLLEELAQVNDTIKIKFWNRPIYEAFYNEQPTLFSHIFEHYFSTPFIGLSFIRKYTLSRLNVLNKKYDTSLYTSGKADAEIYKLIDTSKLLTQCSHRVQQLKEHVKAINDGIPNEVGEWCRYNKIYVSLINKILRDLLDVSQEAIDTYEKDNSLTGCETILGIFDVRANDINESLRKTQETEKLRDEKTDIDPNQHEAEHRHCNFVNSSISDCLEHINELIQVLKQTVRYVVHVFGNAGYGKTNLACSICETLLDKDVPAVLILGSDLRSGANLRRQILENISLSRSMQFTEFLGALDNLGFLKNVKIPIVIDGLNETTPTADIWHHELQYIIQDVQQYRNLILITTCRNSYIQQVFGIDTQNHTEVPESLSVEGFDEKNIDKVIEKYFTKYNITITNDNYPKELLRNPLFLKIFARINQGKSIEFSHSNVYESIEKYLEDLVNRVATKNNVINPVVKRTIAQRINKFAEAIWNNNSRGVGYPDEFVAIFDPQYDSSTDWQSTNSHKVLDEGIFLYRKVVSGKEYAEFTYDLLGGMCIAKAVLIGSKDPDTAFSILTSTETLEKLSELELVKRHPLHEDIIRSVIYLLPKYTGKPVYEIVDNDVIAQYTASMLDIIFESEDGVNNYSNYIDSLDVNRPDIKYFIDNAIEEVLLRKNYKTIPLLVRTLLRMNAHEIDLNWSESIRRESRNIILYLDKFKSNTDTTKAIGNDDVKSVLSFIALLLSSTVRELRDTATKALVLLGLNERWLLFDVFKDLARFADIYVVERLLAALCGVILRIKDNGFAKEVATFLRDDFLSGLETTHVLILDYTHIILEYAAHSSDFYISESCFDRPIDLEWQEDEDCRKEITGDGKATWGYGPIHMDFAKYIIGSLASRGYPSEEKDTPTLKECLAMVIWRMKELGYSEDLFSEIDKEIVNSQSRNYDRYDNSSSTERYGKKYSWVAYFELYGHYLRHKRIAPEYSSGFRVHSVDIDPTFPARPFKTQLVNDCFMPEEKEVIQAWIIKDDGPYLGDYYLSSFPDGDDDWVMLRGYLEQEGRDKTRLTLWLDTVLVDRSNAKNVQDWYCKNYSDNRVPEYYYLFSGEIPWSKNIVEQDSEITVGDRKILIVSPYAFYTWEAYHSICNDIGNVPFVCKRIAQECDLRFNPSCMSYYTASGSLATRYFWDDYSKYLYIRRDILELFTNSTGLVLLWVEKFSKYGDFGKYDTSLNPSYANFRYVTLLDDTWRSLR